MNSNADVVYRHKIAHGPVVQVGTESSNDEIEVEKKESLTKRLKNKLNFFQQTKTEKIEKNSRKKRKSKKKPKPEPGKEN